MQIFDGGVEGLDIQRDGRDGRDDEVEVVWVRRVMIRGEGYADYRFVHRKLDVRFGKEPRDYHVPWLRTRPGSPRPRAQHGEQQRQASWVEVYGGRRDDRIGEKNVGIPLFGALVVGKLDRLGRQGSLDSRCGHWDVHEPLWFAVAGIHANRDGECGSQGLVRDVLGGEIHAVGRGLRVQAVEVNSDLLHGCIQQNWRPGSFDCFDPLGHAHEADGKLHLLDSPQDGASKLLGVGHGLHQVMIGTSLDVDLLDEPIHVGVRVAILGGDRRGDELALCVPINAELDVVIRKLHASQLQRDGSVSETVQRLVEEAVDVQSSFVQNLHRLLALGREENAPERHDPLSLLLFVLFFTAALQEKPGSVNHLLASFNRDGEAAKLYISNPDNVDSRIGRHHVDHAQPVDVPVQPLDPLLE